ncbi:alpha/beta hydrolase [Microvirga brassicacearum]|uniref:Alpha/beta hydrolase n=1 Tax=Microvirga brassicacearum TaxID=2580413 RepID=A0A5N3PCZ0_9HYPH|nr:alpha/beta hydrolase [Microvirga brassicacearum]KAB0267564.1 alpha/beta hydrolase [Microvirga brassicacearum]
MRQTLTIGHGDKARMIAALTQEGSGPPVVWLGGYKSDMRSTKAETLAAWAERAGRAFVRFDYSGHGESGGRFENGTITHWLDDSLGVIRGLVAERSILVGSSMGAWIALLVARHLAETGGPSPAGMVLIAPAIDFTERLMWDRFTVTMKRSIQETGVLLRESEYSEEPYPITMGLIEDGRRHLLFDASIQTGCPVHILQGMKDPDVPWTHAMRLVEHLPGDNVSLTLIKDGDHRLSRPEDLERLIQAIEAIG